MHLTQLLKGKVFSAHAEVVPLMHTLVAETGSILRARGGSSEMIAATEDFLQYSPRTRR